MCRERECIPSGVNNILLPRKYLLGYIYTVYKYIYIYYYILTFLYLQRYRTCCIPQLGKTFLHLQNSISIFLFPFSCFKGISSRDFFLFLAHLMKGKYVHLNIVTVYRSLYGRIRLCGALQSNISTKTKSFEKPSQGAQVQSSVLRKKYWVKNLVTQSL